jgi:hypothetical protein
VAIARPSRQFRKREAMLARRGLGHRTVDVGAQLGELVARHAAEIDALRLFRHSYAPSTCADVAASTLRAACRIE